MLRDEVATYDWTFFLKERVLCLLESEKKMGMAHGWQSISGFFPLNDLMFHENCNKVNLYKARQYFHKLPIAKSQLKDAKEVLK